MSGQQTASMTAERTAMLGFDESQEEQSVRADQPSAALANPRRTRLGPDGRPLDGPGDPRRD